MNCGILMTGKIIAGITLISVLASIFHLLKSFSNLHKAHTYREIPTLSKINKYKIEVQNDKEFNDFLIDEFVNCTTHNFEINKTRTEDLAKAKRGIFFGIILTFLFSIIYILSIL